MSDHPLHGHKITKEHDEYARLLKATVIPMCFVKKFKGRNVCIPVDELDHVIAEKPQYAFEGKLIKMRL